MLKRKKTKEKKRNQQRQRLCLWPQMLACSRGTKLEEEENLFSRELSKMKSKMGKEATIASLQPWDQTRGGGECKNLFIQWRTLQKKLFLRTIWRTVSAEK